MPTCVCPPPTLSGFISWVRTAMGITTTILPDDSVWFQYAFCTSLALVNEALGAVCPIYMLAVYNLGGSNLINFAQDLPEAAIYQDKLPFFAFMRKKFNSLGFVSGVISGSSDEGTSQSLTVPKALENLTLADLQTIKDPWGRTYLGLAQQYGTLWGLS